MSTFDPTPAPPGAPPDGEQWVEERVFRVLLHFGPENWVEYGSYASDDEADGAAQAVVATLAQGQWLRVRGRYLRPETILSVEISERRRLGGSATRARWGHGLRE